MTRHLIETTKERKAFFRLTVLEDMVHHRRKVMAAAMGGWGAAGHTEPTDRTQAEANAGLS